MGRPKKAKQEEADIVVEVACDDCCEEVSTETKTEKEELLALYDVLKAKGINSIGDLENKIANCRN